MGPIPNSELDVLLLTGDFKERAVIHSAIDDFANAFVSVVQSFLILSSKRLTQITGQKGPLRDLVGSRVGGATLLRAVRKQRHKILHVSRIVRFRQVRVIP